MTHLDRLVKQTTRLLYLQYLLVLAVLAGGWWAGSYKLHVPPHLLAGGLLAVGVTTLFYVSVVTAKRVTEPTRVLWQAILHVSAERSDTPAPALKTIHIGNGLVNSLGPQ